MVPSLLDNALIYVNIDNKSNKSNKLLSKNIILQLSYEFI